MFYYVGLNTKWIYAGDQAIKCYRNVFHWCLCCPQKNYL